MSARAELASLILDRLRSAPEGATMTDLAEHLAGLFHQVRDETEDLDVSQLNDVQQRIWRQRWINARIYVDQAEILLDRDTVDYMKAGS